MRRLKMWEIGLWSAPSLQRGGAARAVRGFGTLIRGVIADRLWVRAGYMTYLSLLHLVPIGAVGMAVASRFGWEGFLKDWLQRRLSPTAPELAEKILAAMQGLDPVAIGFVGGAAIIIAGLFALLQLEHDMDDIWVLRGRRPVWKSLFLLYPFAIVIAPALVALALASGALVEAQSRIWIARIAEWGAFGEMLHNWLTILPIIFGVIPYLLTWGMLTAVYYLVPSGPVRFRAALFGGVIAGVLWQLAQGFYLNFQFASATFKEAWGYLAQIPLLLIWIFVSWAILFLGAELAFVWQYRRAFMPKWPPDGISAHDCERAVLAIAGEMGSAYKDFPKGVTTLTFSKRLLLPWRIVERLVGDLTRMGVFERHRFHRHVRYRPTRALKSASEEELLASWRGLDLDMKPAGVAVAESTEKGGAEEA